jgi:hypothetical protein
MKFNGIDFDKLSNTELVNLCLKYNLVDKSKQYNRQNLLDLLKSFIIDRLNKKKQQSSNIKSFSIDNDKDYKRRNSFSGNLQSNQTKSGPPKVNVHKRRLSQPTTTIEKTNAVKTHEMNTIQQNSVNKVQKEIKSLDPRYDKIGIYPPVNRLVCIGDLHGDLSVTLKVLKLAEVIPQNSSIKDINNIHWSGGDSWVIQLGDQIDRCRPDNWADNNCIEDFDDVIEDEGSNMAIIKLFLRLDEEAKKYGGRVLGILGNHELMNVDKDFRYVSPKEFLEFVPHNQRNSKYTDDGYPMGYWHRTKAFERGSNISKLYAEKKKSIIIIGSYVFVHGGLSMQLMEKYTIAEINDIVRKWLLKTDTQTESEIFDEIFRKDDDMSPFWCRIYGEDYDEDDNPDNSLKSFNNLMGLINKKNKKLMPIKGMVISHTPQFMEDKYLNSMYNERLWRIDVGMSRAFGKQDDCGYNKYRKPQILIIHKDKQFEKRIISLNSDRYPSQNMGENVNLLNLTLPF